MWSWATGGKEKRESEREPGDQLGLGRGEAKWPGVGQRQSRSLSSRCLRDRHQTHSPWGRRGIGLVPRLPESRGVKVKEESKNLERKVEMKLYISLGGKGRAGMRSKRKTPRPGKRGA